MPAQVWLAHMSQAEGLAARLAQVLSPDEAARAARLRTEQARRRFVVGRGLLRHLLAAETGERPEALRFVYGPAGKPRLAALAPERPRPAFNLSHAGEVLVIALIPEEEAPVGVDVEKEGAARRPDELLRRFGTEAERRAYFALPPGERPAAFVRWWTRKEALVKAQGGSLAVGLERLSVPVDEQAHHLIAAPALGAADERKESGPEGLWQLLTWNPAPGYIASLAVPAQAVAGRRPRAPAGFGPARHRSLPLHLQFVW